MAPRATVGVTSVDPRQEDPCAVIMAALRRHVPNHLVLVIRFAQNPNDRRVEMIRLFDVVSGYS